MHRIPGDRDALSLESSVELLDAEQAAGVAEEMPRQPSQAGDVAHAMPVHHIAQDRDVDIVPQQLMARRRIQTLRLGEAPYAEPVREGAFQTQAFVTRQDARALRNRDSPMAAGFLERERMNMCFSF